MRYVRWLICLLLFVPGAVIFLRQTVGELQGSIIDPNRLSQATALSGVARLAIPALAVIYVMACLTFVLGKRSARWWGIAASANLIVMTLMIEYLEVRYADGSMPGLWSLKLIGLGMGGLGIAAFARRDVSAYGPPPKAEPGDGTSVLLSRMVLAAGIAGTWFALVGWESWARAQGLAQPDPMSYQLQLLAAIPLFLFIHEGGHALAAMALRMKVCTFGLGPLVWSRWTGRWKLAFCLRRLFTLEGYIQVIPARFERFRRDKIVQVAAGPAASLLTGGMALALLVSAPGSSWEPGWYFMAVFATLSLVMGLLNLIPFRIGGGYSDGAKLYQLASSELWTDYHRVQAAVYAGWVTPLRARDFDVAAIRRTAGTIARGTDEVVFNLMAVSHAFDCGRMDESRLALSHAETALASAGTEISAEVMTCFVFYHAYFGDNVLRARAWWDRAIKKKADLGERAGASSLCALLLAEGHSDEAEEA